MKLAGVLLLASCALLSTLCVANARSIMAVNQQDDYEATLQDLYDSMALKQQEDDGNKMAKEQFWGTLASLALPYAIELASNAFRRHRQEEVAIQEEDYEAVLQDLYDSMALMEQEEDDGDNKEAKEQFWGTIARLGARFLPKLIRGGSKLIRGVGKFGRKHGADIIQTGLEHQYNNNYEQLAKLQDLYDTYVMTQEDEDEGVEDGRAKLQHYGR